MTCPRNDPQAPRHTCWQRIPEITDRREILRCRQCPYGKALVATVKRPPDFDPGADQEAAVPPQEETIIMDKQTYTTSELAEKLGVLPQDIRKARGGGQRLRH